MMTLLPHKCWTSSSPSPFPWGPSCCFHQHKVAYPMSRSSWGAVWLESHVPPGLLSMSSLGFHFALEQLLCSPISTLSLRLCTSDDRGPSPWRSSHALPHRRRPRTKHLARMSNPVLWIPLQGRKMKKMKMKRQW